MYYDIANSKEINHINLVRKARPNISLPKTPTEEQLLEIGIATVAIPDFTDFATKKITSQSVELINSVYTLVYQTEDIPLEEIIASKRKQAEDAVQSHITTTVKKLNYDDENSIAKYLVEGNEYYEECKALSLWIGLVWKTTNQSTATTLEELIGELPIYV